MNRTRTRPCAARRRPAWALCLGIWASLAAAPHAALAAPGPGCAGLPAASGVRVAAGFCAGVAANQLGAPRGLLPLADGSVLVADLGNWERGRGRLLRLVRLVHPVREGEAPAGRYAVTVLVRGLNRPHGLALGPDGMAYLAEDDRISRFEPGAATPLLQPIIIGLPGDGQHPLKSLAFMADGSLLVGVGSASNNCEGATGATCPEAEGPQARAAVWRYERRDGAWVGRPWATGLRNPLALTVDAATGQVWQGENGRDGILAAQGRSGSDEDTPHDELNRLVGGGRYGWPYCFDAALPSPEFPAARCAEQRAPQRLLPAHAAPLGLAVYRAAQAPAGWRNSLLITHHGYRRHGHRVVGIALDADGLPRGPARDLLLAPPGPPGRGRLGAFTDIRVAPDGSLWVSDDRAGTVLRIVPSPSTSPSPPPSPQDSLSPALR